jgi:hypothetical protein
VPCTAKDGTGVEESDGDALLKQKQHEFFRSRGLETETETETE